MAVSIYEVATQANVSIATVSRVLSGGSSAKVAPATEKRVRDAARRLEYYPSGVARGLARGRMNTIGLVLYYEQPSVTSDPYLGPCLDGILAAHKRAAATRPGHASLSRSRSRSPSRVAF